MPLHWSGLRFKVSVDKQSDVVTFHDPADKVLLRESTRGRRNRRRHAVRHKGRLLHPVL